MIADTAHAIESLAIGANFQKICAEERLDGIKIKLHLMCQIHADCSRDTTLAYSPPQLHPIVD